MWKHSYRACWNPLLTETIHDLSSQANMSLMTVQRETERIDVGKQLFMRQYNNEQLASTIQRDLTLYKSQQKKESNKLYRTKYLPLQWSMEQKIGDAKSFIDQN